MPLLAVLAHLLNILICILSNYWVVAIWANDDMTIIGVVFRIRVGAATSKTRPQTLSAIIAACTWKTDSQ
jgi:hypothetical protein